MRHTAPAQLSECGKIAYSHDSERYLCALFADTTIRESWFALLAFNVEVRRIKHHVSEPMMGLIRLQWWADQIDALPGVPSAHPVLLALASLDDRLDKSSLQTLIIGREQDFSEAPPMTAEQYIAYADATGGVLHRALAHAAGVTDHALADAARRTGRLWELLTLLRQARQEGTPLDAEDALIAYLQQEVAALDAVKSNRFHRPLLLPARLGRVYLKRLKTTPGPVKISRLRQIFVLGWGMV